MSPGDRQIVFPAKQWETRPPHQVGLDGDKLQAPIRG